MWIYRQRKVAEVENLRYRERINRIRWVGEIHNLLII